VICCGVLQVYLPGTAAENRTPDNSLAIGLSMTEAVPEGQNPKDPETYLIVVASKPEPVPILTQQGQKFIH
jgi:hypothetical protein